MKYLHKYEEVSAFTEDYNGSGYTEPWVSYTNENDHVDYNKIDADFIFDAADMLGSTLKLVYSRDEFQVDGRDVSFDDWYYYTFGSSSELLQRPESFKIKILNANLLSEFENTLEFIADDFDAGSGGFSVQHVFDGIGEFHIGVTTWNRSFSASYQEYV